MTYALRLSALAAAFALAACGGGTNPPPGPASQPAAKHGIAVFRIKVPKKRTGRGRSPRYVSPATQSLVVVLSGPTPIDQTLSLVSSPNCTNSLQSAVCTFTFAIAPGHYTATLSAYDNAVPASGKLLSAGQSLAFAVAPGAANPVNLTLSGVPAQVVVTPGSSASRTDVTGAIDLLGTGARPLLVQALDADGNAIVGPGSPTFTATQTSGSLALTLGQPTASAPNALTVTPPGGYSSNTAKLSVVASYTGQATNGCAQPGAVCSTSVVVQMSELLAVSEFNQVEIFQAGLNAPLALVTAGVTNITSIAFDASGDLIVANCNVGCGNGASPDLLTLFAPPYNGLPVTITNGVNAPEVMDFDSAGNLYLGECYTCRLGGLDNISIYPSPLTAASAPTETITTNISNPSALAFDSLGNLFVASHNNNVREYSPPFSATSVPVNSTFASLSNPVSILLDSSNQLYAANNNTSTVTVYASPYSTLKAKVTNGVSGPTSLAINAAGDVFVSDNNNPTYQVTEYAQPLTNISTPLTTVLNGVNRPNSITIDAGGTLFVANGSGTITQYGSPYNGVPVTLNTAGGANQLVVLP
jgi:hypothetical protein